MSRDLLSGFLARLTIEAAAVQQNPRACPGLAITEMVTGAGSLDHPFHRKLVGAGKQEVALIVGWNSHHSPGAVAGENVISDPDRD